MTAKQPVRTWRLGPMLSRGFWALMGVMHVSAFAGAWRSCLQDGFAPEALGGCIALSVSMCFFLLKLGGVSFLRLRSTKRAWLAIGLTVALIHVESLQPGLHGTLASECTAILATGTLVGGLTQLPRALRSVLTLNHAMPKPAAPAGRSRDILWLDDSRPHCWVLASRLFCLRAPPSCTS